VNEAFAAVVLKFMKRHGRVSHDTVNVNGRRDRARPPDRRDRSAMLVEHRAGGARASGQDTLRLVTMCTGGGMGTATIIERI
jgi:acetyl-CoA C-acetyltransferase